MGQNKFLNTIAPMHNCIDWENARKQIMQSFTMSDSEVNTCIAALEHAMELYHNCFNVPERISLTNKKGHVLHTIITRGGEALTVYVRPKEYFISTKLVAAVVAAAIAGSFVYYYYDL